MSINGIFNIGRNALNVNQTALQVTGNNIANVNTPGYSRQSLVIETTTPFMTGAGPIGTGVRAEQISRVYDRFLSFQVSGERENYGRLSEEKDSMSQVEGIFNEVSGSGIKDNLSKFFNSLKDLSNNAGGYAERSQVLSNADALSYTIRTKAEGLNTLRSSADSGIISKIGEINNITTQVVDLNQKIAAQELNGSNANDLRDKRDLVMSKLSDLINYRSIEDSMGRVSIFVGKGSPLVEGINSFKLSGVLNSSNLTDIKIDNGSGLSNITADISGGGLKGLLNIRDVDIPGVQNRLNSFAANLVNEFNTQHSAGYGLDGSTGLNFFSFTPGNEAATISVAITNPNQIAAAAATPGPADNRNALLLAGIEDKALPTLGNATLDSYYTSIVTDVGSRSQQASKSFDYQKFTKDQLETRISSVSGVNLDEEAANLIKFQKSYQASAKLITTADEMMQTILDLKR